MPRVDVVALAAGRPSAVVGSVRNEGVDPKKVEQLLNDVKSELGRVGDEVKRTAEDALKQAKDAGKTTDELKAKADELLTNQQKLTEAQNKLTDKMEALETRNQDIEQSLASGRGAGENARKSVGQMVAEHEDIKAFVAAGCKGNARIALNVNQAITSLDSSAGDLIWSDRETEIVGMPRRQMTIRALLGQGRTGSNLVEYAKQITRTNNAAPTSEGGQKPESSYAWGRADARCARSRISFMCRARRWRMQRSCRPKSIRNCAMDSPLRRNCRYSRATEPEKI